MRNKIIFIVSASMLMFSVGCSSYLKIKDSYTRKHTARIIERYQKESDTVFLYSLAFTDYKIMWFHKDNYIYGFKIKPYSVKRYKPVEAEKITLDNEGADKYFVNPLNKKETIQCFESVMDGELLGLYIKGKNPMHCSINTNCLFDNRFNPNSFPYLLQYYFFKLGICPKGYDFEQMYSE